MEGYKGFHRIILETSEQSSISCRTIMECLNVRFVCQPTTSHFRVYHASGHTLQNTKWGVYPLPGIHPPFGYTPLPGIPSRKQSGAIPPLLGVPYTEYNLANFPPRNREMRARLRYSAHKYSNHAHHIDTCTVYVNIPSCVPPGSCSTEGPALSSWALHAASSTHFPGPATNNGKEHDTAITPHDK